MRSADVAALVSRHRRLLAAVFAAAATAFALSAMRSAAPRWVPIPTAARDLPSGATLRPSDVRPVSVPAAAVPAGVVRSGLPGRVLAGPMRRGEPVTDARLIGSRLLNGYGPGLVAVPVRMADAGSARLLRPGDRIDVLTAPSRWDEAPLDGDGSGDGNGNGNDDVGAAGATAPPGFRSATRARQLVSAVPVIAIPGAGGASGAGGSFGDGASADGAGGDGALVVVAARRDQAAALATSPAGGSRLSFVIVG